MTGAVIMKFMSNKQMNNTEDVNQQLYSVWDSRKETLAAIYKKLLTEANKLQPYDAVFYTNPLSDILLSALTQLENYNRSKDANELINNVLNDEGSDTTKAT
jgi:thioredoxin-like negative regulator of GroEL